MNGPQIQRVGKPMLAFRNRKTDVRTDDYSNVISLLDYRGFSIGSWMGKTGIP